MSTICRRTVARVLVVFVTFLLGFALAVGPAVAYAGFYKTTSSPMAARTAYGIGLIDTNFNQINGCQNPTFSSQIYLKTTGGSTIRYKSGNCGLYYQHAAENSTNAWCGNLAWSSKFAWCYAQG